MFTDRYIKVPVDLYDRKAEMIGFNADSKSGSSFMKINPYDISYYRPADDDEDNETQTLVNFRDGSKFHVALTIHEFEMLLNGFNS